MSSLWQKTMFYLGLVDEDRAEAFEQEVTVSQAVQATPTVQAEGGNRTSRLGVQEADPNRVSGRRVEPPLTRRRMAAERGEPTTPAETSQVRTMPSTADLESQVIEARSYSDAQALADHIRASIPVVLDLRKIEPAMVRRLVDFSSGLTYALGGSMRKVGQGVILVTPPNINLSRDERRRLSELGYYQVPDGV